jgi:elongation factor G
MEKQIIFLKFILQISSYTLLPHFLLPQPINPITMPKTHSGSHKGACVANLPTFKPEDIRNIAFVGHAGVGKTTLAEAIAHRCGVTTRMGSIEEANTISDFEPETRQHKHSTNSVLMFVNYQQREINLIDTPGYPDFVGQALAALPAVETAVIVINAQQGIEFNARRLYHAAGEMGLARMIVVNKIDLAPDLPALVEQLKTSLGSELHCINLPCKNSKDVIDCFDHDAGDADFSNVLEIHREMVESVVEMDDQELEKYLAGAPIALEELRRCFIKAMNAGHVVPILFTSAKNQVGIDDLLHILAEDAPSPVTAKPKHLRRVDPANAGEDRTVDCPADPNLPLLAHVFKVTTDPYVGKLCMMRILQGKLDPTTAFLYGTDKKTRKAGHVLKVEGRDHPEAATAYAGDIVAVAKLDDLHVDQIVHSPAVEQNLRPILPKYPTPMFSMAVEPKSRGDEVKISAALAKLTEEDPTFRSSHDPQTHELVIHGLGDLHLRVMLEKMKNRFNLEVVARPPRIAYRETISTRSEGHYRHKKQTGGAGQFGEVFLRIEPQDRGKGCEFVNEVFGGTIPSQYISSVEKGVRDALERGPLGGYPLQDVRVIVYDGKSHPVDSKDIAFRIAAKFAVRDAIMKARPVLLEPVVALEIVAPETQLGGITGDLNGRRSRITGTELLPGSVAVIRASAPLAELTQYDSQLRSATGGQGSFVMEFSHYDPVPPAVQAKISAQYKPPEEE